MNQEAVFAGSKALFEQAFEQWAINRAPGLDREALRLIAWEFFRQGYACAVRQDDDNAKLAEVLYKMNVGS